MGANSTGKNKVLILIWCSKVFFYHNFLFFFYLSLSLSLKRNLSLIRKYNKSTRIALGLIIFYYGKTISVFSSWSVCEKKSLESEGKWGRPFSLPPFLAQLHSLSQEFALRPPNSWLENRKKVVKSLSILVPGVGVGVGGTPLYMPYR